MRLHNCYTIRAKGKTLRAYNALAHDFWSKAATHPDWAKYIVLADDGGGRLYKAVQRTYVQSNPARGPMRACYAARIDCPHGKRYVWVGLCYDRNDAAVMSKAEIDYRSDGEQIQVGAVIHLRENRGGAVCFCGGDNPLARRLLGCGKAANYTVGWGTCDYPATVCERTDALIAAKCSATFVPQANGFAFATAENMYGDELVLYADSVAVLRAVRPRGFSVRTLSAVVDSRSAILTGDTARAVGIASARIDGVSLLRMDTSRVYTAAVAVRSDGAVRVGVDAGVKSDPAEEYVALYTAAYAEAYRVESGERTLCLRVSRQDEYVEMCRGGALALWGESGITVYEPNDDGTYDSFTAAVPKGDTCVIVREGARYHAATVKNGALIRYEVTRGGVRQIGSVYVSSRFLLGRAGDAVAYADSDAPHAVMLDSDCSDEFACSRLDARPLGTPCGLGNGFFALSEKGDTTVYDLVHDKALTLAGKYTACARLLYGSDGAFVYDYYNGVRQLYGEYDLQGVTSACIAGNGLFAVCGGVLRAYYCSGDKLALRLPRGNEGKTVLCNVRESTPVGTGRPVKLSI